MSFNSLEKYHWNSNIERPIVVIDFKVYARDVEQIIKYYLKNFPDTGQDQILNYMKAIWAFKLNRGCDCLHLNQNSIGFTGIVVDDIKGEMPEIMGDQGKGYWRNFVSFSEHLPVYKGSRKPKDEIMLSAVAVGLDYLQNSNTNFFYFGEKYFEADDLAGILASFKRKNVAKQKAMYLSTLDGDWQVLVSDEYRITWCNTKVFNDRIRGNAEVINYYQRKENVTLDHPSQVSELKVHVGDAGDNLFAGSPLRLFDLIDEDEQFKISTELRKNLKLAMESDRQSNNPEHFEKAVKYLMYNGYRLPETQNPTEDSYNSWLHRNTVYPEKIPSWDKFLNKKLAIA